VITESHVGTFIYHGATNQGLLWQTQWLAKGKLLRTIVPPLPPEPEPKLRPFPAPSPAPLVTKSVCTGKTEIINFTNGPNRITVIKPTDAALPPSGKIIGPLIQANINRIKAFLGI